MISSDTIYAHFTANNGYVRQHIKYGKGSYITVRALFSIVGMTGFEPATTRPPDEYSKPD